MQQINGTGDGGVRKAETQRVARQSGHGAVIFVARCGQ